MVSLNPLRSDPQKLGLERRLFIKEFSGYLVDLQKDNRKLLVDENAFGLLPRETFISLNTRFRFMTDDQKLTVYKRWLKEQFEKGLLKSDTNGKPWTSKHIESAYRKGIINAYMAAHPEEVSESLDFVRGSRESFLRTAFSSPQAASKIRLLGIRTYDQLEGFTPDMGKKLNRIMAEGIANGTNARKIASEITKQIGIERWRAVRIARTELAHSYAEGQLDSFEAMGIRKITVMAEWTTAGDPCKMCEPMNGVILTTEEARGLIPRHPNCRCAWAPAYVGEFVRKGKVLKSQIEKAIAKSVRAEHPRVGSRAARLASRWAGADKRIKQRKAVRDQLRKKFTLKEGK